MSKANRVPRLKPYRIMCLVNIVCVGEKKKLEI